MVVKVNLKADSEGESEGECDQTRPTEISYAADVHPRCAPAITLPLVSSAVRCEMAWPRSCAPESRGRLAADERVPPHAIARSRVLVLVLEALIFRVDVMVVPNALAGLGDALTSLLLGVVIAKVERLAVMADLRSPLAAVLVKVYAAPSDPPAVQGVLAVSDDTQIGPAVIEHVAVDVIDKHPLQRVHDDAVHELGNLLSSAPAGDPLSPDGIELRPLPVHLGCLGNPRQRLVPVVVDLRDEAVG